MFLSLSHPAVVATGQDPEYYYLSSLYARYSSFSFLTTWFTLFFSVLIANLSLQSRDQQVVSHHISEHGASCNGLTVKQRPIQIQD